MRADLRHGVRLLLSQPGFTIAVVLTLGLGIGASTAVYSLVDAVLLKPLPYPDPDRIVSMTVRNRGGDFGVAGGVVDAVSRLPSIDAAAATVGAERNLVTASELSIVRGALVTSEFFDVFKATPLLGRTLNNAPSSVDEIVLAERLWRERFASDPQIVGRGIRLDERMYTVVGVMGTAFEHPEGASYWCPYQVPGAQRAQIGSGPFQAFARVSDAGLITARAETEALSAALTLTVDGLPATIALTPLLETIVAAYRRTLIYVLSGVGFVLLIACGNAGHLVLARTLGRAQELAVRTAIGATRARILWQLVIESSVLAAASGLAGLALAWFLMGAIPSIAMSDMPRLTGLTLDARVLAFAVAVCSVSVLFIGICPAWLSGSANQSLLANRATPSRRARRAAAMIVTGEIALTVMLVLCSGLATATLVRRLNVDVGFDPRSLSLVALRPSLTTYVGGARGEYYQGVTEAVRQAPGIEAVAGVSHVPLAAILAQNAPLSTESDAVGPARTTGARARMMVAGTFAALCVPILKGRDFEPSDRSGAEPVALVNSTLAARLWRDADPVGRMVRAPVFSAVGFESYRVIGVVGNFRGSLRREPEPELYVSALQRPPRTLHLMVRSRLRPADVDTIVRAAIGRIRSGTGGRRGGVDAVALSRGNGVQPLLGALADELCVVRAGPGGRRHPRHRHARRRDANARAGHPCRDRRDAGATGPARHARSRTPCRDRLEPGHRRHVQPVHRSRAPHSHRSIRAQRFDCGGAGGRGRRRHLSLDSRPPGRAHRPGPGAPAGIEPPDAQTKVGREPSEGACSRKSARPCARCIAARRLDRNRLHAGARRRSDVGHVRHRRRRAAQAAAVSRSLEARHRKSGVRSGNGRMGASDAGVERDRVYDFSYPPLVLAGSDATRLRQGVVSYNLLDTLGVVPILGRGFTRADADAGAEPVVILTHGVWLDQFGGQSDVIGEVAPFEPVRRRVIGVLPSSFLFPMRPATTVGDARILTVLPLAQPADRAFPVVARLAPSATLAQARAEETALVRSTRSELRSPQITDLASAILGSHRSMLTTLLGAVGLLLLIACGNVTHLLLARALDARRDIAVMFALGASRSQVGRVVILQGCTLCLAGGVVGVLFAYLGFDAFTAMTPVPLPRADTAGIDLRVVTFAVALSIVSGLIVSMLPAWQLSRMDLGHVMQSDWRSTTGSHRLRHILLAAEVSLAVVLLAGAGLAFNSFVRLLRVDLGFDADRVLTLRTRGPESKYPTPEHQRVLLDRVLDRLAAMPDVDAVGAVDLLRRHGRSGTARSLFSIDPANRRSTRKHARSRVTTSRRCGST